MQRLMQVLKSAPGRPSWRLTLALTFGLGVATRLAAAPMPANSTGTHPAAKATVPSVVWHDWSEAAFAQARREHRYVLLDLQAVWCHWCHVMDHETYADPAVATLIATHYIALKADQDANPDLSNRYGDWGWPATIVFAPDGSEIVKRRGFIAPANMASLLQAIVDDPSPGPSVRAELDITSSSSRLDAVTRTKLQTQFDQAYDDDNGGWGSGLKYIDAPAMELLLTRTQSGDRQAERRARQTFDANLNLIDPVWGGVYQYSDAVDWHSPHFEKIMSYQADDLRLYALAYARWGDPRYLAAAQALHRYLTQFLQSPDGAFYVSQDADLSRDLSGHDYYPLDDTARRKLGLPRIDTHIYARENGWAIAALCRYADATGDVGALTEAIRAARWILANRSLPGGGFRHDAKDRGGPFLGDSASMGMAFVSLYRSTGTREWLDHASATLSFIDAHFRDVRGGFISAPTPRKAAGVFAQPLRLYEENLAATRLAALAYQYNGNARWRDMADQGMRYLAAPALADSDRFLPGVLLADAEVTRAPVHIAVVGHKDDSAAQSLHAAALAYPAVNLRVDWWDAREGALPNADVKYPQFAKAAAYGCTGAACSSPVFAADKVRAAVDRIAQLSDNGGKTSGGKTSSDAASNDADTAHANAASAIQHAIPRP